MTSGKAQLLDPETLAQAAREVAEITRQQAIPSALVGGFALQFYGSPRLTGDIDVVVGAVPTGVPVLKRLSFGGIKSTSPNGVPTDFIVRDDEYAPLYREALADALRDSHLPAAVVAAEYLAAMKLAAGRTKDDADLEWMIAEQVINLPEARRIIEKHLGVFAAREFDTIVAETQWKKETGKLE